jgi:excinuclease ABC subunit C
MATENARVLWEERYQRGGGDALITLARNLSLEVVPSRIECYVISHLAGIETVGSMVVAAEGKPEKSLYRRFKVTGDRNDDFASMRQVLERRLNEYERGNEAFTPLPDLLVVDGGLGQTNIAQQVLVEMGYDIPVIGLAKKHEEIYFPGQSEPLRLPLDDEGLRVLARLRDEAHRFAITYNRQRREKKARVSVLDNIPGIGEKRRQALLTHLGSVKKVREASVEELAAVPGMNAASARAVWEYFHTGG